MVYEYVNDTVTIYGVFHTSRDKNKWRNRLPSGYSTSISITALCSLIAATARSPK